MKVSAKVDYAVQAVIEIAHSSACDELISAEEIAAKHQIPEKFLEGILTSLRKAGLINSFRGPSGGYQLAKPAESITIADVIRTIDGPLAAVRGYAPEEIEYRGSVKHLDQIWIATRSALREVLEHITISDALNGKFEREIAAMLVKKDAKKRRKSS